MKIRILILLILLLTQISLSLEKNLKRNKSLKDGDIKEKEGESKQPRFSRTKDNVDNVDKSVKHFTRKSTIKNKPESKNKYTDYFSKYITPKLTKHKIEKKN